MDAKSSRKAEPPDQPSKNSADKDADAPQSGVRSWLFQYTPDSLTDNLLRQSVGRGDVVNWRWTKYTRTNPIQTQDLVYFWRSGEDGGLMGWGTVQDNTPIKPSKASKDDVNRIAVRTEAYYEEPVQRHVVRDAPGIEGLRVVESGAPGTNFSLTDRQADALTALLRDHKAGEGPLPTNVGSAPISDPAFAGDKFRLRPDNPARSSEEDRLGRQPLARNIARRLQTIRRELDEDGVKTPFMVHVHAPWGAGKSSFLNFLREELVAKPQQASGERPVVVTFNAWRHHHVEAPWWHLIAAIYGGAQKTLGERGRLWAKTRLFVSEIVRRYFAGRTKYWLLVLLTVGVFGALAWLLFDRLPPGDLFARVGQKTSDKPLIVYLASYAAVLVGFVTAAWKLVNMMSDVVLTGSTASAARFIRQTRDAHYRIRRHFRGLVKDIGAPLYVFIDDIDRCEQTYVVKLLEGIQTLFDSATVVYVIAGDRRWLHTCFETVYDDFGATVQEPGKSLGYLFLQKAFQLSIPLPGLSEANRGIYLRSIVEEEVDPSDAQNLADTSIEALQEKAQRAVRELGSQDDVFAALNERSGVSVEDQLFREEVVLRLADEDIQQETQNFLVDFQSYMDPNPRAMKRLVNEFVIFRDFAIPARIGIESSPQMREQLAFWTILVLRWPELEAHLVAHPDACEILANGETPPDGAPETLAPLFADPEVHRLFKPDGKLQKLDRDAIKRFAPLLDSSAHMQ